MLSELFIYISISLLFLSTLILPIGNYYNDSNRELAQNKINESMEYIQTKSQNELEDYVILANEDYVLISKLSIENKQYTNSNIDDKEGEDEDNQEEENIMGNIVNQFKLDKRYFYNKLNDNQKEYKGYKVIAEFSNGVQIYPKLEQRKQFENIWKSEKSEEEKALEEQ